MCVYGYPKNALLGKPSQHVYYQGCCDTVVLIIGINSQAGQVPAKSGSSANLVAYRPALNFYQSGEQCLPEGGKQGRLGVAPDRPESPAIDPRYD